MADALASGASGSNTVQVQLLSSAPFFYWNEEFDIESFGGIAQLVRAFASHARGQGFDPLCLHQIKRLGKSLAFLLYKLVRMHVFGVLFSFF